MNWIQRFLTAIATHKANANAHHTPPGDGDLAPKAHKDSHDPIDGADKLDTAVPVKVGAANAIGSSHSLARADHVHEREHAIYAHPAAPPCRAATAAQTGHATAAQITKLNGIATGADVTGANPPQAHKDRHDPIDGADKLDTAAPVKVAAANAIGSSHSFSRADHVHEREHAIYAHPAAPPCRAATAAQTGHATAAQITKLDSIEAGAEVNTKEFFVPVTAVDYSGDLGSIGDFPSIFIDAPEYATFAFKCPHDFTALTHCKIILIPAETGLIDWTVTTDFAAIGEAYTTHSDSDTDDDVAVTINIIQDIDISAAFTNLAADDYVGVKWLMDKGVTPADIHVIGLVFKYS